MAGPPEFVNNGGRRRSSRLAAARQVPPPHPPPPPPLIEPAQIERDNRGPPPSAFARVYYDPSHPASYGSITALQSAVPGATRLNTINWLKGEETYTLHRPVRRRFQRNPIVVDGIDDQWAADLLDVQALSRANDGYKYLLTIVDTLSKKAWVRPLKDKTAASVATAFENVFRESGRVPRKLRTDQGLEFRGQALQTLLEQYNVHYFTSNNETKEAIVERFNRTLRSRLWRYFEATNDTRYVEVLPKLVEAYNHKKHRSIGMAPNDVTPYNAYKARERLYDRRRGRRKRGKKKKKSPKLKVDDRVRLSKAKPTFEQGYKSNWTDEIFTIHSVNVSGQHPRYKVRDDEGEVIRGSFQESELQKVRLPPKRVVSSRRRKKRGTGYDVTWRGYPKTLIVTER